MLHTLTAWQVATHPVPAAKVLFGADGADVHRLSFYVWVVRGTDGGVGLVDAGLPPGAEDLAALRTTGEYDDVVPLADVLAAEGLAPGDVDWCCVTQVVTYHTGGLLPELLPRADVWIARAGLLELLLDPPGHPPTEFFLTAASWSYLRELAIDGRLHAVDEPSAVAPGVTFETTGGHHPGSAAVRVQTADGLVGILETAFVQENVEREVPVGISEDVARCRRAIRRYKRECDVVLADHDPAHAVRYGRS
jgi:glyoxylase-like metal-dependent hydrolase (beta-lactamase superfamily II)